MKITIRNVVIIIIIFIVIFIALGFWSASRVIKLNREDLAKIKEEFELARIEAENWDSTANLYNIFSIRSKDRNIDYFVFGSYFNKTYGVIFDRELNKIVRAEKSDTKITEGYYPLFIEQIEKSPALMYRATEKALKENIEEFTIFYYQKKTPCLTISYKSRGEKTEFPPIDASENGEDIWCY